MFPEKIEGSGMFSLEKLSRNHFRKNESVQRKEEVYSEWLWSMVVVHVLTCCKEISKQDEDRDVGPLALEISRV